MANPSASAAPAAIRACLGVAFALLLLLASSSGLPRRRAQSADPSSPSVSVVATEARGLRSHEDRRRDAAAGSDGRDNYPRVGSGGGGGFLDYLYIFYCVLGGAHRPFLGYAVLACWLAALFYLLADTAATYFCASLEGLARLLRLPPAIAGATLLSLGNGAPDALSAIASFATATGRGGAASPTAAVGLSGVLGGAMFVSSAVLGVIAVRLGEQGVAVHRAGFFRDAGFLLLALGAVAVVVAVGNVTVWAAAGFASLYVVYVLAVALTPDRWARRHDALAEEDHASPAAADFSELHNVTENKFYTDQEAAARDPHLPDTAAPLLQHYPGDINSSRSNKTGVFWTVLRALELPLSLPRRLTIPDAASKDRWSKPFAVTAATLAPVFLSLLWSHRAATTGIPSVAAVLLGVLAGLALGVVAFLTTDASAPPTRLLGAWLAGGFAMSVAWAYVLASEVLSLLVAAGAILAVDSAALGVTVLAWGNSVSDLVANVAVASRSRGGGGGAQVAVSGCYGGPVFNVLVGLGVSMLLSCWSGYPRPVEIPREPGIYRTLAFVVAGLLWAVVMLPRRGMRVDRTLGIGLLGIYFCFLCINVSQLENER